MYRKYSNRAHLEDERKPSAETHAEQLGYVQEMNKEAIEVMYKSILSIDTWVRFS